MRSDHLLGDVLGDDVGNEKQNECFPYEVESMGPRLGREDVRHRAGSDGLVDQVDHEGAEHEQGVCPVAADRIGEAERARDHGPCVVQAARESKGRHQHGDAVNEHRHKPAPEPLEWIRERIDFGSIDCGR